MWNLLLCAVFPSGPSWYDTSFSSRCTSFPLAANSCAPSFAPLQVLVWHTRTEKPHLTNEPRVRKDYVLIEVWVDELRRRILAAWDLSTGTGPLLSLRFWVDPLGSWQRETLRRCMIQDFWLANLRGDAWMTLNMLVLKTETTWTARFLRPRHAGVKRK